MLNLSFAKPEVTTHLLYTGYGYKPSRLQTPFQKTSTIIWLSCIAVYRTQFPTPAMMFEPSLYPFFFSCFVNQAVRYFQLVAKHPAFFEIHKQPLAASKRQQPDDKLRLSVYHRPSFIRSMLNTGNTVQLKNCTQKTYQECDLYNVQSLKRNVKMYKI